MQKNRINQRDLIQVEIVEEFEGRKQFYLGGVFKGMRRTGELIWVSRVQYEQHKDRLAPVTVEEPEQESEGGA